METIIPIYNVLAVAALVLLLTVTGGVVYLTLADWRDRRRQERDQRSRRR
ncbi:hypothetical protein ACE1B6_25450 [Aerosakkonemataceae cyanobacterium BLCC-F154]|uniref:Uncharacterized protein n=1 Tax=Floridaenema fluviatile BLCC-F154 TaxID=3153640 RepID=A0ABV4YL85_9CYAN